MYKRRTILEVQDWGDRWQVVYIVEHVPEPGDADQQVWAEQAGHCFPKDTFEWRAAEYGIDPRDMATLLDIVLAEPFLEAQDYTAGESLHDAPSISMARQAHLRRCAQGKLRGRVSTRAAKLTANTGPLEALLQNSPMDETALSLKKEHVALVRQEFREQRPVQRDRIEDLRIALRGRSRG